MITEYARFLLGFELILKLKVTLLDWKEEDLSPDRKGGILRKRVKNGDLTYLRPNQGATVESTKTYSSVTVIKS